jgi:ATP-dependent Clp protease protease subunit
MQTNKWYAIQNAASDAATVRIFSEIGGWGISAEDFANDLAKINAKTIHLRINSPGGDVFAASAIYNSLRNHKARVISYIDGLAASAATIIMLAADEVRIAANGFVMIHEASSGVWGTESDMRKTADLLDKLNHSIADTYAKKTGKTREEMLALMNAETWFNADEAKAAGLVDTIEEEAAADASAMQAAIAKYQSAPVILRRVAAMLGAQHGQRDELVPIGASTKAATPTENLMNLEQFKAFAAENPQAAASLIEQGKKAGIAEARDAEKTRFKAIREACGDNIALACELFDANKEPEDAKIALEAIARAKAEAEAASKAQAEALALANKQIERLKAEVGTQSAVGTAGAAASNASDAGAGVSDDPQATAESEWTANPELAKQFTSKEVYLAYRVNELRGRVRFVKSK